MLNRVVDVSADRGLAQEAAEDSPRERLAFFIFENRYIGFWSGNRCRGALVGHMPCDVLSSRDREFSVATCASGWNLNVFGVTEMGLVCIVGDRFTPRGGWISSRTTGKERRVKRRQREGGYF